MSFDIKNNDPAKIAEAGYEFAVILPDGTETDFKIKVRGINSPKVQEFWRKHYNETEMRKSAAKRRGKTEADELTLVELEEFQARNSSARIISWANLEEDKVAIVYSHTEAERVMKDYKWLREIVLKESDQLLNFRHNLS